AARAVAAARGVKPVATLADGTMASAAYWIGAYADEVYAVDSGTQLGSIGVVATHVDVSRAEQMAGRKTTEIYAGQYKRIASSYAPLTEPG
ncbi:S49 family peptidase, partial [Erwinia amylovora]|uniref:S49 family peptidase n=1 Tax=Erwinia amylovora TaxID=552 RepID=UPI00200B13F6